MSELMLVNPRKRRRKSGKRRMSAKQAKYFSPRRKRRAAASSPRRRRRASARRAAAPVARRARRRSRRSFLRNTSGSLSLKPNVFIRETLIPSAVGGAGALAVDAAWAALPLPAQIKSGPMAPVAKAAGAVAVGLIASKVAGKKIGAQVTSGYLTVLAYNLLKGVVQKALPQMPLGDYGMGYVQAGQFLPDQSIAAYLEAPTSAPSGVGAYLNEYEASNGGNYAY